MSTTTWIGIAVASAVIGLGLGAALVGGLRGSVQWRTATNVLAATAAALVFGAGLWFVIGAVVRHHHQSLYADPTSRRTVTTTVVKDTSGANPKVTKTVTKTPGSSGGPAKTATTVVTETAGSGTEKTTTTAEANDSLFERGLAGAGFLFFRIALAALAAFLAGMVVQRTLLGDFAIKVGPVEVPDLPAAAEASKSAIEKLTASLKRQTSSLGRKLTKVDATLDANTEATVKTSHLATETARAVTDLRHRVERLESGSE